MDTVTKALRNILHSDNALKVLDVGTGRGEFLKVLMKSANEKVAFLAVDSNVKIIDAMKEEMLEENVDFKVMTGEKLEFEEASFDVVSLSNTLHHLDNPKSVLEEMKRVLKPTGYMIINEMVRNDLSLAQETHMRLHHLNAEIDTVLGRVHKKTYSRDELTALIDDDDLMISEIHDYVVASNKSLDEISDDIYQGLHDRIKSIEKTDLKNQFEYQLLEELANIQENGFENATEILMIAKKF